MLISPWKLDQFVQNLADGWWSKSEPVEFLPRDGSAEHGDATVSRLSVRDV